MARTSEVFELAGRRITETDSAVLWDAVDDRHWFPLSQVEAFHVDKDGIGTIIITAWIAKQKGLL